MSQMIYIHYQNGRVLQGVVLALGDHMVRVAVKDTDDAVEFRLVNQSWVSEDCEVVTMEFEGNQGTARYDDPDPLDRVLESQFSQQAAPRVM